jgi:hypothetical protein
MMWTIHYNGIYIVVDPTFSYSTRTKRTWSQGKIVNKRKGIRNIEIGLGIFNLN